MPGHRSERHGDGFTLIEMLLVVSVVGILAAVAYPSYESQVRKSRRIDAKNALLDLASRQERHFSIHNKYSSSAKDLGYAQLPAPVITSGRTVFYTLSVISDGTSYSAKAAPEGAQRKDTECYSYTITHAGDRSNASSADAKLTAPACW